MNPTTIRQDPRSGTSKITSFRSRILGTWDLVYYIGTSIKDPNDIAYPMGKDAKGQLIYTNDGYMSALLQDGNLKPFEHDWKTGNPQELASAAKATMAYGGPFYLDDNLGAPQKIIHHVRISMQPNLTDTLQVRCADVFEEDGQTFIMLGPESPVEWEGVERLLRLKWQKRPENKARHPPTEARELRL